MAVDQVRESLVAGLEQTFPAKLGLDKLVFGKAVETTYDTEKISIDVFDGTRGAAQYTARGAKGQTVGLEGWDTIVVNPPLIDERFTLSAQDLKLRNFGEGNVNAPAGNKLQTIVNRQLTRIKNRKQMTYNKQIKELITTGKVTIVEYDDKGNAKVSRTEDFQMPSTHIYTVGTPWNNGAADIWSDMRTIDELIIKDSGLSPDRAIIGKLTIMDMLSNTKIKDMLKTNSGIKFGEAFKQTQADGLIYWGNLDGKDIYEFIDFDESGNSIIPASAYIPFASTAELDIHYGSQDVIVNGMPAVVESKEVAIESIDEEAVAKSWKFKSAKLYALTQSAAFGCLTTR